MHCSVLSLVGGGRGLPRGTHGWWRPHSHPLSGSTCLSSLVSVSHPVSLRDIYVFIFETRSGYVEQVGPNLLRSSCLSLLDADITGMHHCARALFCFLR